jgi:hypothetical protein
MDPNSDRKSQRKENPISNRKNRKKRKEWIRFDTYRSRDNPNPSRKRRRRRPTWFSPPAPPPAMAMRERPRGAVFASAHTAIVRKGAEPPLLMCAHAGAQITAPRPFDGGALPLGRARAPAKGLSVAQPLPSPPAANSAAAPRRRCERKVRGREKRPDRARGSRGHGADGRTEEA